jgi:hypothetical protein
MSEINSPFEKFILKSVSRYLQTVVLIDDRIDKPEKVSTPRNVQLPPSRQRKSASKSAGSGLEKKENIDKPSEEIDKSEDVCFHDIQNSFAEKKIICSLYQPKQDATFDSSSDVYNLCSVADVVVVDWDIHGDAGSKATELVVTLIEQSMKDVPHQLRLVLIYTLEPNLGSVADRVYEALTKKLSRESIEVLNDCKGLVLTSENARVVVLGKKLYSSLQEYSAYYVPEKELAKRTIIEFSHLASGLLQCIILQGIASLRENNRRILMRFHKGLDAAFLAHRALLMPDEAFGQIIPMLTDELRAVLEDNLGEYPLGEGNITKEIISDWCQKHWKPATNAEFKLGDGADPIIFAKDVFCNGPNFTNSYSKYQGSQVNKLLKGKDRGSQEWNDKKCDILAEYLSSNENGDFTHEFLSALMSQRLAYENSRKSLHLGVILKKKIAENEYSYMLCLQPVCDSVRVNENGTPFIFCLLYVPENGSIFTHTVTDSSKSTIRLVYKANVNNCYISLFSSDTGVVFASNNGNGQFFFKDKKNNEYEWVAELKTEHAQRAAEEFGRILSRVGLTESEWLRLKNR